ncbi:MAG: SUMF1/EgtB/PvdO family nonheme iron enzyme [Nitrospirae bacterium]|nr:SUMF1/EgtB/PvdO family nonheme iron enzyme [Nitrospirota bacterium]MBF0540805.1 SUMF1/EgtB/PvdO family nonheme iron enzyme [Nitrospirota bacterium]
MGKIFNIFVIIIIFGIVSPVYSIDDRAVQIKAMKTEKRVALVIGNGAYKSSPLNNPVNDALAMAKVLESLNFEVISGVNLTKDEMMKRVIDFGNKIKDGGVGLFYFAGHGVQYNGQNYLIPIDAKIDSQEVIEVEAMSADYVLARMDAAKNRLNIVILDACRNNPFARSFRSVSNGLAQMKAPEGSFIAYATAPGSVASDGGGKNGLYTQELIKSMNKPGLKIEEMFKDVRISVESQSGKKQTPWESSSITGDFYFKIDQNAVLPNNQTPVVQTNQKTLNPVEEHWETIKNSTEISDFRDFIRAHPKSKFVAAANAKIKQLDKPEHLQIEPQPSQIITTDSKHPDIKFVFVKGGCFQMGETHRECVNDFYIGRYEVTQGQWKKVMGSNPSYFDKCGDNCPVERVSWNDVQSFIEKLNNQGAGMYRLPKQTEWEYACRSRGRNEKYSGGDNVKNLSWNNNNSGISSHIVGQKDPNGLGIYDMSGNVWEWTQDHNRSQDERIIRGGSWRDDPKHVRCTTYDKRNANRRGPLLGFRLLKMP